jgi:hypothetical protein
VNGESGVVGLDDSVRHLGGRHDGESGHHAVGELLADLGDQKRTHTGTGSTTKRVGDLEALEAVAPFGLAADNIENLVDQLGALSVMTLCPVVTSTGLAKDEVVGAEELSERASADGIHGTGLQIDENSAGNVFVAGSLSLSVLVVWEMGVVAHLIEVDVHALELEVGGSIVPGQSQDFLSHLSAVQREATYTPEPSRPCSPEMFCLFAKGQSPSR